MSIRVERTQSSHLWKPFEYAHRYELREDVFIMNINQGCKQNAFALVPASASRLSSRNCYESAGYNSAPASIEAYQNECTNWTNVAGIARAGTILEPCRLDRFYQFSLWYGADTSVKRYATILTGELKGAVVNIEDLHWNPNKYLQESTESARKEVLVGP